MLMNDPNFGTVLTDNRSRAPLWLLLPKVLAVFVYIGGIATVLGLWLASHFTALELADPRRQLVLSQVSHLMIFLVVPALLLAILFGVILALRNLRGYLALRWMQIKLIGLLGVVPSSHFFCETRFNLIRRATTQAASDLAAHQFTVGLILATLGSIGVALLGRFKPRLNQFSSKPSAN